jgi:N6-L-threonylcarbamoyladenine synthase
MVELAARAHTDNITTTFKEALTQAHIDKADIELVAYTNMPGMISSLMVGACFAKGLAYSLDIPCISVNHLQAHVFSSFIGHPLPDYPYLSAVISGGHSNLYYVVGKTYTLIGQSLDDSAGETLDKCAKLMGYAYPGGPKIETLASQGTPRTYTLPLPMSEDHSLNLSFSGLKSAFARTWAGCPQTYADQCHLSHELQRRIVQSLIKKLTLAIGCYPVSHINFVGGVSRNRFFQDQLNLFAVKHRINLHLAHMDYCQDNAAMIAYTGYQMLELQGCDVDLGVDVQATPRK